SLPRRLAGNPPPGRRVRARTPDVGQRRDARARATHLVGGARLHPLLRRALGVRQGADPGRDAPPRARLASGRVTALDREVGELLGELARRWTALELGRMRELWDLSDPDPVYIAEELRHPVVGWEAFDEYWLRMSGRLRGASYRTGELRTR